MNKTLIIAEAGVNHNGDLSVAKQLIDAAVEAGADYVKFQTFKADNLVAKTAPKAEYQQRNASEKDETQYQMLKKLELSKEAHIQLLTYCNRKGIRFLSTAFDLESIEFLSFLHLGIWKIPSGEITNYPYLKRIAAEKEPIILSTGMSSMEEIAQALEVLTYHGVEKQQLTLLHCNTEYPTPMQDVNLLAMCAMKEQLGVQIGYSDHTVGIEVPIAAVALGAKVIEKHFTLNKTMEGPDHKASLEPHELKQMISAIRNIEQALGKKEKVVTLSEYKNKAVARKSIVAAYRIEKGEVFTEKNLTVKRPGTGLSPMRWNEIIGTCAFRSYSPDELIEA